MRRIEEVRRRRRQRQGCANETKPLMEWNVANIRRLSHRPGEEPKSRQTLIAEQPIEVIDYERALQSRKTQFELCEWMGL